MPIAERLQRDREHIIFWEIPEEAMEEINQTAYYKVTVTEQGTGRIYETLEVLPTEVYEGNRFKVPFTLKSDNDLGKLFDITVEAIGVQDITLDSTACDETHSEIGRAHV